MHSVTRVGFTPSKKQLFLSGILETRRASGTTQCLRLSHIAVSAASDESSAAKPSPRFARIRWGRPGMTRKGLSPLNVF
jgi:hypothetical protein